MHDADDGVVGLKFEHLRDECYGGETRQHVCLLTRAGRRKHRQSSNSISIIVFESLRKLWSQISMDFMKNLPSSRDTIISVQTEQ